jgi:hypothetical protein
MYPIFELKGTGLLQGAQVILLLHQFLLGLGPIGQAEPKTLVGL